MKLTPITAIVSTLLLNLAQVIQPAMALNFNVDCRSPEAGIYTLGWGTSRLIIPKNGRAYITFRGKSTAIDGTICKSGDNIGVVVFRQDGTVWAYVRANEN
ncbi:MAG: hypothetical protein DCF19_21525 [Pseudanabaena frigida]|uniref:Uncharacterized protein n=1 Tax=Pseudanabaena frigida TaxID=945775 RepID=A0A2W4VU31_9CYAN|nr:MAG: hypothetical protein DCF19_21525 [Pseudanabaena frigida]